MFLTYLQFITETPNNSKLRQKKSQESYQHKIVVLGSHKHHGSLLHSKWDELMMIDQSTSTISTCQSHTVGKIMLRHKQARREDFLESRKNSKWLPPFMFEHITKFLTIISKAIVAFGWSETTLIKYDALVWRDRVVNFVKERVKKHKY